MDFMSGGLVESEQDAAELLHFIVPRFLVHVARYRHLRPERSGIGEMLNLPQKVFSILSDSHDMFQFFRLRNRARNHWKACSEILAQFERIRRKRELIDGEWKHGDIETLGVSGKGLVGFRAEPMNVPGAFQSLQVRYGFPDEDKT